MFSFTEGNTLLNTNSKYYAFPDKTECVSKINYHPIKDIQNYIYHFSKAFIIFYFRKYPESIHLLYFLWFG